MRPYMVIVLLIYSRVSATRKKQIKDYYGRPYASSPFGNYAAQKQLRKYFKDQERLEAKRDSIGCCVGALGVCLSLYLIANDFMINQRMMYQ